jgi:hypothetical protein
VPISSQVNTYSIQAMTNQMERLLEAFQDIPLTIMKTAEQTVGHVTALKPLQQRILELLGFSAVLYTELGTISPEPP